MEIQTTRTESMNSYEFGKAVCRHKLYYWTVTELKIKIKELVLCGLIEESPLKETSPTSMFGVQ